MAGPSLAKRALIYIYEAVIVAHNGGSFSAIIREHAIDNETQRQRQQQQWQQQQQQYKATLL